MSSVKDPSRKGGFFLWWRQLPKEVQSQPDTQDPIQGALWHGILNHSAVSLMYRMDPEKEAFTLLLYPREIYKRGAHVYVEGRCYPSGNYQTLGVDRIISANTVGGSASRTRRSFPQNRFLTALMIFLILMFIGWLVRMTGR